MSVAARVRAVAEGATINGTYRRPPGEALEAFRADLLALLDAPEYPTEDAYLRACRASHWRTAQLRAHGIEPVDLSKIPDAPHYPPEDYDFDAPEAPACAS